MTPANQSARGALRGLVDALVVFDDPQHRYHQVVSAVSGATRRAVKPISEAIGELDRFEEALRYIVSNGGAWEKKVACEALGLPT